MRKINYKQNAECLAKDLLGKAICYEGKKYMITVTEAYPYDEEPDNNGNAISYVNRPEKGKGYNALIGDGNVGYCFSYAGMLHIACGGGKHEGESLYRCGNVLIRGGILIENDKYQKDNKDLNYKKGQPYKLCKTLLNIDKDFNEKADEIIKDYKSFPDKIKNDKRIGLNSDNPYRYYLDLDELK
jgi:3-methyladenine DNA glycosylase Mpg